MKKNQYIQPKVAAMTVSPGWNLMLLGSDTGPQPGNSGNGAPTRVAPPVPGGELSTKRVL
jgi:hypothetical protein